MPLVVKDRVKVTTTTTGTGTLTLGAAAAGFQSFSVIGNANTTYYAIVDSATGAWEVGIGTYTASGTTLSRDTVLESSNAGALVSFAAGSKDVFVTYPADFSFNTQGGTITGSTVIEVTDNTNAALRITQLGTANALLVEDSTNPDATPFVVNASGNVGIGTTTPTLPLNIGDSTLPAGVSLNGAMLSTDAATTTPVLSVRRSASTGNAVIAQFTSSGTAAAPTAVASGRGLGLNSWYGFDGTNYINAASITANVDGTPGTNDMPGRIVFNTTADGASSPTERMRIDSAGNVGIGKTATTALDVNGTVTATTFAGAGTNLTGTASININGTVGATTANTGAFTTLSATGVTTVQAGTVSAPAITTTGDTNTGIFFPAADTIAFAEGGVEALRITSAADLQFNSGYGSVAAAYGCRAWVNFNGTGTPAIRNDGNVTSITDNGTGDYTVNFTNSLPDINYAVVATGVSISTGTSTPRVASVRSTTDSDGVNSLATGSVRIGVRTGAGGSVDIDVISVAVFR